MNKKEALQKYKNHFDEPLFENHTMGRTNKEIIEMVEESIEKNKTHIKVLQEEIEKEFGKEAAENANIF